MLFRFPYSFAIVFVAFAVAAGVFLFLRPEYHDPFPGTTVDFSGYPAPSHGWRWKGGTPGFVVRSGHEEWNISGVRPRELPRGARLLAAQRNMNGLSMFVVRGRCIGAALPDSLAWFCPPQLDRQVAFVAVDAIQPYGDSDGFAINLAGITRAGVRRVVVTNPEVLRTVHRDNTITTRYGNGRIALRIDGAWGAFEDSTNSGYRTGHVPARPWRVRLDFYGAHRLLASQQLAFARPGTQLVVVP